MQNIFLMGPSIQTHRIHRKIKGITSNFDFFNDFNGGRGSLLLVLYMAFDKKNSLDSGIF